MPTGVVMRRTAELVPYANNARTHTPEQNDHLGRTALPRPHQDRCSARRVRPALLRNDRLAWRELRSPVVTSPANSRLPRTRLWQFFCRFADVGDGRLGRTDRRRGGCTPAHISFVVDAPLQQQTTNAQLSPGQNRQSSPLITPAYHGLESLVIAGQERLTDWLRIPAPPCLPPRPLEPFRPVSGRRPQASLSAGSERRERARVTFFDGVMRGSA